MFDLQRLKDSLAVLQGRAAVDHETSPTPGPGPNAHEAQAFLALILRVGLGAVFVIGGLAKLSRLLSPAAADGIVAEYMGPLGYINATFQEWLFTGPLGQILTPWTFLTALSAFELLAGLMLIGGLFNGYHKVPTFGASGEVLALIGLGLIAGVYTRAFALAAFAVIAWYMIGKIGGASGLLGYANSVKREIALVAGALALAIAGGGARFTAYSIWAETKAGWSRLRAAISAQPKNNARGAKTA